MISALSAITGALLFTATSVSCDSPLAITLFSPANASTVGVAGKGWVVDFAVSASNASSVFPSYAGTVPFVNSPLANNSKFGAGNDSVAQGLVVLCNTTQTLNGTAFAGPSTNLASYFQLNAIAQSGPLGVTEAQYAWFVGAANYGLDVPSMISVFVMNSTAPKYFNGSIPTTGLLTPVVNSTFLISGNSTTASNSTASSSNVTVAILAPGPSDYAGINGSGFLFDMTLTGNATSMGGYSPLYQDAKTNAKFGPGHSTAAPGLVVLSNTTVTNTTAKLMGPTTNLAGLFQITGVSQVNGSMSIQTLWQLGAPILGSGVYSSVTAYLVMGTAPDVINATTMSNATIVSNNVTVPYYISALNGTFAAGAVNSTLMPNVTGTMKR